MFYGIEYAYGSTVINNGNRADRVYGFEIKEDRDKWVSEGPDFDGPGFRDGLRSTHRLVRKARGLIANHPDTYNWTEGVPV